MAAMLVGLRRDGAKFTHISIPEDVAKAVSSVGSTVSKVAEKVAEVVSDGKKGDGK
jgi:hypothetical protein